MMRYQLHPCPHTKADYVVLVSGLGGHGAFWQPQLQALTAHFHVLCYDQEGCDVTDSLLPDDYCMRHLSQQLFNLLDHLNITRFHVIGHALGGFIAAELLPLIQNERLEMLSLTVINGWYKLDPHTTKCFKTRMALLQHAGTAAYIQAQALFLYPPAWISAHITQIQQAEQQQQQYFPAVHNVLQRLTALMNYQICATTAELMHQMPLLLLANRDDFLVPYQQTEQLFQQFPHAQMQLFPSGGHASTVTQSAQINVLLIQFLQRVKAEMKFRM